MDAHERGGGVAQAVLLVVVHRRGRPAAAAARAGFDLGDDDGAAAVGRQIQFAARDDVVAGDDAVSVLFQILLGDVLAESADAAALHTFPHSFFRKLGRCSGQGP